MAQSSAVEKKQSEHGQTQEETKYWIHIKPWNLYQQLPWDNQPFGLMSGIDDYIFNQRSVISLKFHKDGTTSWTNNTYALGYGFDGNTGTFNTLLDGIILYSNNEQYTLQNYGLSVFEKDSCEKYDWSDISYLSPMGKILIDEFSWDVIKCRMHNVNSKQFHTLCMWRRINNARWLFTVTKKFHHQLKQRYSNIQELQFLKSNYKGVKFVASILSNNYPLWSLFLKRQPYPDAECIRVDMNLVEFVDITSREPKTINIQQTQSVNLPSKYVNITHNQQNHLITCFAQLSQSFEFIVVHAHSYSTMILLLILLFCLYFSRLYFCCLFPMTMNVLCSKTKKLSFFFSCFS